MKEVIYQRDKVVSYARKWALKRNPKYYDFSAIGGDCTNFVSQCVYAGCRIMNYNLFSGWFYTSPSLRAPAWSGVDEFYNFATTNKSVGFYAETVSIDKIMVGDVIQLGNSKSDFYHAFIVTKIDINEIYVCSHSVDRLDFPLSYFNAKTIRPLHVIGARDG